MSDPFRLDPRLADEGDLIASLPLCDLLLRDDARTLWLILVPRVAHAVELHDLGPHQQQKLMAEVVGVSRAVAQVAQPTKVNTGALGNIVRQLHIHVVARHEGDVRIWRTEDWTEVATLSDHGQRVYAVAFSRDGTRLASGDDTGRILTWDTSTWVRVLDLQGHADYVYDLAWSPTEDVLASASGDGTVRLWGR